MSMCVIVFAFVVFVRSSTAGKKNEEKEESRGERVGRHMGRLENHYLRNCVGGGELRRRSLLNGSRVERKCHGEGEEDLLGSQRREGEGAVSIDRTMSEEYKKKSSCGVVVCGR